MYKNWQIKRKLKNVPQKKTTKKKPRAHYLPLRRTSRRQRRLSCLFCLEEMSRPRRRDGLVVVRTNEHTTLLSYHHHHRERSESANEKGNICCYRPKRGRTKREAMSPSLLSDSRVLLHSWRLRIQSFDESIWYGCIEWTVFSVHIQTIFILWYLVFFTHSCHCISGRNAMTKKTDKTDHIEISS